MPEKPIRLTVQTGELVYHVDIPAGAREEDIGAYILGLLKPKPTYTELDIETEILRMERQVKDESE